MKTIYYFMHKIYVFKLFFFFWGGGENAIYDLKYLASDSGMKVNESSIFQFF